MAEMISLDQFKDVDLRVAEVLEVSDHPNADKLFVVKVSLGDQTRQLVAGLKARYKPEDLVGKKVIVVTNLQPAVLRGVESQGMILAAQDDSAISVLTVDRDVSRGSKIL